MKALALVLCSLLFGHAMGAEYKYYASDVIRYALTAHGIKYVLRDKSHSIDAWDVNLEESLKVKPDTDGVIPMVREGNTDCSGLAMASIRIFGFKPTTKKHKGSPGTYHISEYAKEEKNGLFVVEKKEANLRPADIFNRVKSPYGHVMVYNGKMKSGRLATVEARGRGKGVGKFTRSLNELKKYSLIRSKHVYNDLKDHKKPIVLKEANADNRSFEGEKQYKPTSPVSDGSATTTVEAGDSAWAIAKRAGISLEELKALNPDVDWFELSIGQTIVIAEN